MWVNKDKGIVFCLMEAPDKDACFNVHQKAHGDTGCNIIEVNPNEYDTILAKSLPNAQDIAVTEEGILDTAYRTVLWFEIISPLNPDVKLRKLEDLIKENKGSLLLDPQPSLKAVFVYPSAAFRCANQIKDFIDSAEVDYRLAIVSGKPVEQDHNKFYGYAFDLSKKLAISGEKGRVRTTQLTMDLFCQEGGNENDILNTYEVLSLPDEQFLCQLIDIVRKNFTAADFSATDLAAITHSSRSQLFRRIKKITTLTPNTLITEIKLNEAVKLLSQNKDQIAQIAYNTGFNSPSYFSKIFSRRFRILPSEYVNILKG
jgi:AraC-like DNA-binding protein